MFYRTRRILRTLLFTGCSEGNKQQVTGSLLSQKSKIGSKIGSSKDESFFRDGIRKLPERWEKVVGNDEQYFN